MLCRALNSVPARTSWGRDLRSRRGPRVLGPRPPLAGAEQRTPPRLHLARHTRAQDVPGGQAARSVQQKTRTRVFVFVSLPSEGPCLL